MWHCDSFTLAVLLKLPKQKHPSAHTHTGICPWASQSLNFQISPKRCNQLDPRKPACRLVKTLFYSSVSWIGVCVVWKLITHLSDKSHHFVISTLSISINKLVYISSTPIRHLIFLPHYKIKFFIDRHCNCITFKSACSTNAVKWGIYLIFKVKIKSRWFKIQMDCFAMLLTWEQGRFFLN